MTYFISSIILYFILSLIFISGEKLFSKDKINRTSELKLNILSLLLYFLISHAFSRLAFTLFSKWEIVYPLSFDLIPPIIRFILALVFIDFYIYLVHSFMHSNTGWNTHRWHHSTNELYWLSGLRTSIMQIFMCSVPRFYFLVFIFQLNSQQLLFYYSLIAISHYFQHTSINIGNKFLELVLVTPRFHRIHHMENQDSRYYNIGIIFTFWDRLFGTMINPEKYSFQKNDIMVSKKRTLIRDLIGV